MWFQIHKEGCSHIKKVRDYFKNLKNVKEDNRVIINRKEREISDQERNWERVGNGIKRWKSSGKNGG